MNDLQKSHRLFPIWRLMLVALWVGGFAFVLVVSMARGAAGEADPVILRSQSQALTSNKFGRHLPLAQGTTYTRPLLINNLANTQVLTSYPISITVNTAELITAEDMRTDCGDIRFYDSDGVTALDYWLASGCNSTSTQIWIKIPTIPGASGKKIYLTYGNSSLTTESNGVEVFDFFDNFDDEDIADWVLDDSGQTPQRVTSTLHTSSAPYSMKISAGGSPGCWNWMYGRYKKPVTSTMSSGNYKLDLYLYKDNFCSNSFSARGYVDTTQLFNVCPWDGLQSKSFNGPINDVKLEAAWLGCSGTVTAYFDDVRVRKYSPPEPNFLAEGDLVVRVNGSAVASPKSLISYTLTITNIGTITTPNVIVTHTLPLSVTYLEASISPSQTNPLIWGLGELAALTGQSLIVTGTVNSSATFGSTLVATAVVTSDLASEARLVNNTASYTSTVGRGSTGADGSLAVANTVYVDTGRYTVTQLVSAGSITLSLSTVPDIGTGDEVLIITMQSPTTLTVGLYETAFVAGRSGAILTLTTALANSYTGTTDKVVVQRIPHYTSVTVEDGGLLTAHEWNGETGGIVFFRAQTVTVESGGVISATGLGYRGGPGAPTDGYRGESLKEPGLQGAYPDQNASPNNGGGGANVSGGGGNYGGGATKSDNWVGLHTYYGGAGSTYGTPDLAHLYLGSGGGGAHSSHSGGDGGGIIYIAAESLKVLGNIEANGTAGVPGGPVEWYVNWYGGGGGSGGSIYLTAAQIELGTNRVTASGASGSSGTTTTGGDGGVGRIRLDYNLFTGSTTPAAYEGPALVGADLRLTLSGSGTAPVGGVVSYTVTITNASTITVPDVVVTHTLPVSVTYSEALPSPAQTGSLTTWQLGDLPALASRTLLITGTVNPSITLDSSLRATVTVTSPLAEANLGNNTAIFTSTAVHGVAADLVMTGPAETDMLVPFEATVTVYDAYGNVATGYEGNVSLSTTDSSNQFPVSHQFSLADQGVYTFTNLVLKTAGGQIITPTDGTLAGTFSITVDDEILVDQSLTWDESDINLQSLVVTGTGTVLTLQGSTVITAENITIGENTAISADGQGHVAQQGLGGGTNDGLSWPNGPAGSGGGYGGYGGARNNGAGAGGPYGAFDRPDQMGSGGGSSTSAGGAGGGAIHLVVGGILQVDGRISANGNNGLPTTDGSFKYSGGGGSGGSIWLEVETLSGGGQIQANGGSGGVYHPARPFTAGGGGGSGGRIAVDTTANTFSGTLQAIGGRVHTCGGGGTIYLSSGGVDQLLVDNDGCGAFKASIVSGPVQFDTIQLSDAGNLEVKSGITLTANSLQGDSSAWLTALGTITATEVLTFHNVNIIAKDKIIVSNTLNIYATTLDIQGELVGAENITLDHNGQLWLQAGAYPNGSLAVNEVDVLSGTLRLAAYDSGDTNYANDYGFTLSANNLQVAGAGLIEANGLGYSLSRGPGAHNNGSSHGGYGGGSVPPYGDLYQPDRLGSSGDNGRGGGAIRLVVTDVLTLNGAIQANGVTDGSGGSVWLQVSNSFTGTGQLQARGGNQLGGGGRIAVYAPTNDYTGSYSAAFGGGGDCPSGLVCEGTVYLNSFDPVASTIVAAPNSLTVQESSLVTVTLKLGPETPLPSREMKLSLSPGTNAYINGQPATEPVNIGTTDSNGVVTATITSTLSGLKVASAQTVAGETLTQTALITFTPGPVDPGHSLLAVIGSSTVAADGVDTVELRVTARDGFDNPLVGASVELTSTAPVSLPQGLTTNSSGLVTASITSTVVGTAEIEALVDGILIEQTRVITFEGADLTLAKGALPEVTAGYPLTYNLAVANNGFLTATNVVVTDTLPAGVIFKSSSYTVTQIDNQLVWELGDLGPEQDPVNFVVVVTAPLTAPAVITNQAVVASEAIELDTADNLRAVATTIKAPAPVLTVSPLYPTLVVSQGLTGTLVVTVTNSGTGLMTDTSVTSPPFLPWVEISPTDLGDLLPGESVTVTVEADAGAVAERGHYRDRLVVETGLLPEVPVFLDVHIVGDSRDLQLTLKNNAGALIEGGDVILREDILVVTEGVTGTETYDRQGFTDEAGQLTFAGLEADKAYFFDIAAPQHVGKTGTVSVTAGAGPQAWLEILTGLPGLTASPSPLTFGVARGGLAQQALIIHNTGVVTLTNLSLTPPADLPWVYLGQPPADTIIPPGGQLAVLVNAAPALTETIDVYNDEIEVDTDEAQAIDVPLEITLNDGITRTLCIDVETTSGSPLLQASVRLVDQAGQVVSTEGVTETVQQVYLQPTDTNGRACFADLTPGPYLASVGRDDQKLGEEQFEVTPGVGNQVETMMVEEPSITVNWSVVPTTIGDEYTTVMTMTFIPEAPPRLSLSPRNLHICDLVTPESNGILSTPVTIHNFYPVTFTNAVVDLQTVGEVKAVITSTTGASVTSFPNGSTSLAVGTIGPNQNLELSLHAKLDFDPVPACLAGEAGAILLKVSADYEHYQPNQGWYTFGAGGVGGDPGGEPGGEPGGGAGGSAGEVALGQQSIIPLKLTNSGYPDGSNLHITPPSMQDIHLTPPQNLPWLTISPTQIISIPVYTEADLDLIVNAPQWLAQGFYYDHIVITASNSITALIGIEAEMSDTGLRIRTQFVTPLEANEGGALTGLQQGRAAGLAYPLTYAPAAQGGVTFMQINNTWQSLVKKYNPPLNRVDLFAEAWTLRVIHCQCGVPTQPPNPIWERIGNQLIFRRTTPEPIPPSGGAAFAPEFKDNIVRLEISQRYALEREAFSAKLELINGLTNDITDLEVDISIVDAQGVPMPQRQAGAVMTSTGTLTPNLPTDSTVPTTTLVENMPASWLQSTTVNFTVIPTTPTNLPNLSPAGSSDDRYIAGWVLVPDAFGVTDPNGEDFYVQATIQYEVNGVPKVITTTQELITVHPQPKILLDYFVPRNVYKDQPFDWIVVATNVGYGHARNFTMDKPQLKILQQSSLYPTNFTLDGPSGLTFASLAPGQQEVRAWQITADRSGVFVDLQAACIHHNYLGVELPRLVYCSPTIHFIDNPPPLTQAGQWGKDNGCMVAGYQAFSSDPVNTFSGNFTYNQLDVTIPTWSVPLEFERSYNSADTEVGPLGPGWTHNYNMDITFDSYISPQGGPPTNLLAVRLPRGSRAYFEVSEDGNTLTPLPGVTAQLVRHLDTYTLTQVGDQLHYVFNAAQKLAAIEDANGNRTTLTYSDEITSSERRLLYVTDPAGRRLTFDYDAERRLIQMTDPLSRTALYTYTNGYLTEAIDFRGYTTSYTYTLPEEETPGRLVSITDRNNNIEVTNEYDEQGRVIRQWDANEALTTFTYTLDSATGNQATTMTDPLGKVRIDTYSEEGVLIRQEDDLGFFEQYEYDDRYRMIRLIDKRGYETHYAWHDCNVMAEVTDPLSYTTQTTVDDKNQITSMTDERGFVTVISYDNRTNPLTITNPLSGTTQFSYGSHGEVLSKTDENGHTTFYGYDSYGNTTVITDALGHTTHMSYDLAGRLLSSTDALDRPTSYSYDPGNNLLSVVDPLTGTTTFTYDPMGNRLSMVDALARETSYEYDTRNNLVKATNPISGQRSLAYDANNNIIQETDENGRVTTYQYDGLNRLLTTTNALSGTMSYTYDPKGNRLTERDARGNVTSYVYDANDRIIETVYPDGSEMTAAYDATDHLLSLTDGAGRTLSYAYDALGRVTVMTDPLSGTVVYSYDAVGNQLTVTDAAGRVTQYEYDQANRLVQSTDPLSGVVELDYDAVGNLVSTTDAEGRSLSLDYDALRRLVKVTDPLSGTLQYSYDAVDNKLQQIDPLGRVTRYSYDALNRLVQVINPLTGTTHYSYDPAGNLLSSTDPESRTVTYSYDALNRLLSVTDPLSGTSSYTYDPNGNLLTETDPENRTTSYSYDVFNQRLTMTDPEAGITRYGYDQVGNLAVITDTRGYATRFVYDGLDRVVTAQDALSYTIHYGYDPVGNMLAKTDQEGRTTSYLYDALDRLITIRDVLSQEVSYSYDHIGNLLSTVDAENRQTQYSYDALDRLTGVTNALSQTTSFSYDAVGNQVSVTDALGRTSHYTYDALDRLIATTDPLSGTSVFTYSLAGNLLASQDALGRTTQYSYDALNRLIEVTDALNQRTRYSYDRVGNQLSLTDALSRTTRFEYDGLDRLVKSINPLGGESLFSYDPTGNVTSVQNPKLQLVQYDYDALGRLVQVTDPLEQVTQFLYDKVGNQVEQIDPKLRATEYRYDALYRLIELEDAAGNVSSFSYDKVGNQLSLTDAEGRTTTTTYDALNRPLVVTNPLSGTTTFTYDEVGNLAQVQNPKAQLTQYQYDALDRLIQTTDALGGTTLYSYDAVGNLTQIQNPKSQIQNFEYDALNRLIQSTNALSGVTRLEYDAVGNLLRQVDPLDHELSYTLDALDRIIEARDAASQTVSFSYDAIGNLLSQTDPRNYTSHMSYDPLNRLVSLTDPLSQTTSYEYDEIGNTTAVIDPLERRVEFDYDALDRLTGVTDPLERVTGYSYDKVGNQTGLVDAAGVETRYSYDALDRLTEVTENFVEGGPANPTTNVTTQYSYDAVGNLTQIQNPKSQSQNFEYDALNRLVRQEDPLLHEITYDYDALGNLVEKVDANEQTTTYSYDALNRLTGITRPGEPISFSYDAVGNRLSMTDPTGTTSYSYDNLYRLTAVTDPLSQTLGYGYDENGNRTRLTYPDDKEALYSYDAANRLISVEDWDGFLTTYNYDAASQLVQLALPNGITTTYGYDTAGQLTLIQHQALSDTLASYAYSYDEVGNRTQAVEAVVTHFFTPTAVFTGTPLTGPAPLTVTFTSSLTYVTELTWDFGDGYTQTITSTLLGGLGESLTTTHTYTQAGLYTVTLTAANPQASYSLTRTSYIAVIPPGAFLEENGQVVIEAEHFHERLDGSAGFAWNTRTEFSGYEGTGYVQARPDRGRRIQPTGLADSPSLHYQINFTTPGTYTLWLYGAATNAAGDSLYVDLSNTSVTQPLTLTGFVPNTWRWTNRQINPVSGAGEAARFQVASPGAYTLTLWMREDGLRLDRLLLTTDTVTIPAGTGPAESDQGEGQAMALPASSVQQALVVYGRSGEIPVHALPGNPLAYGPSPLARSPLAQDPSLILLSPLAAAAPLARSRRWRRLSWLVLLLFVLLAFLGLGTAVAADINLISQTSTVTDHVSRFTHQPFRTPNSELGTPNAALPFVQTQMSGAEAVTITYSYDPLYRLTGASDTGGQSYGYSYDAAGNRLTYSINSTQVATYTYDAANRLTQVNDQLYSYDDNGNLLDDGIFNYTYDSANRLTGVVSDTFTTEYLYNGDGVRIAEIQDGLRTDYVQDIAAALPQVLTARQGGTLSHYLRGLGLIGEQRGGTGPFAGPATWQYNLPDALGSVRQVTDPSGQVQLTQRYDPFGGLESSSGLAGSAYGFAGEEQDPETGKLHLRARGYDPATGRFLQQDSLTGEPGQPNTQHRYAYGFNNPVNYTDPTGHMPPQLRAVNGGSMNQRPIFFNMPAVGYASSPGTQSAYLYNPSGRIDRGLPPVLNAGTASRSANNGAWSSYSDPYAQQQSQGHRPPACGFSGLMMGLFKGAANHNLGKDIEGFARHAGHMLVEAIPTLVTLGIGLIPGIGSAYDFYSLNLGYDPLTGRPLSDFEKGLMMAGIGLEGASFFGDDLLDIGRAMHRLSNLDVTDATRASKGIGSVDEVVDVGRRVDNSLLRQLPDTHLVSNLDQADDVAGLAAINNRLSGLDGFTGGNRALQQGDDLRRSLANSAQGGTLSQRLETGSRLNSLDQTIAGNQVTKQGSDLRRSLTGNNQSGSLSQRLDNCVSGNSFTAGTPVQTDEGRKPIEEIKVGDKVLAEDPETGEQGYFEVVALTNHPTDEVLQIMVDSGAEKGDNEKQQLNKTTEMMEITPDHPVYVEGKGWVWAENLAIGDKLRRADGGWAKVLAVEQVKLAEPEVVYNFTVKGPHTYFVLEVGVLVHNVSCTLPSESEWIWAPRGPNGPNHSRDLQRAFIEGLDDGNVMAVRPMDWGVWSWERLGVDIQFKPMAATKTLFPNTKIFSQKTWQIAEQTAKRKGRNFADLSEKELKNLLEKVEPVKERLVRKLAGYRDTNAGILLADADVAWAIKFDELKKDYLLIDNEVFHKVNRVRMQEKFIALGHKNTPVLHGPHMNVELMLTVKGLDPDVYFGGHRLDFFQGYYKDTVYIYGRNYQGQTGYLGFGTMEQTLNTYAPNWRELTDGGWPVPEYGKRYLPDGVTSMKILEVLDHLEQFRSFPKTLR